MRWIVTAAASVAMMAGAAWAEERPRSILVLDGSGSMWGQIDGTAKITIAQDVVGQLLGTLPDAQELGLTVYGHRRKGDCTDIETLVAPGPGTRAAIADAVNAVTPRGKTPLSDAVIAAAEALKYTEEAATVILVSDGRETCEADPCAVGRALEEAGVDFTAHVVGFDVSGDEAARAELQCLADETGGQFLLASNAAELGAALAEVADEPVPVQVTFRAIAGDGPEITDALMWDVSGGDGPIVEFERGARITLDLVPGDYTAAVLRPADEATTDATFTVGNAAMTVTLVLPAPLPEATLDAADSAPLGSTVAVTWDGPDGKNDYVAVADPNRKGRYINYAYTRNGNPAEVMMPATTGTFELRYFRGDNTLLATRPIEVTPVTVSIDAPDSAPQGANVPIAWEGPGYKNDYIAVAPKEGGPRYINYRYTRDGSPADLAMPPLPGDYVVQYVLAQGSTVLTSVPITVTPVEVTLDAPASVLAGSAVPVTWTGPDYRNDYIAISKIDGPRYETYTYTREGGSLTVKAPLDAGEYELRYIMAQDNTVLAAQPLTVTNIGATLTAASTLPAGAKLLVEWEGPGYKGDYISIAVPDTPDNKYLGYTYTREGSPLTVRMPPRPGTYELRYLVTGSGAQVLARQTITLTPPEATITAAATAPVRGQLAVDWTGPDYRGDVLRLVREGETRAYVTINTAEDAPVVIDTPEGPGAYELQYVIDGKTVIATAPVTLTLE
ncbi:vWA domain-containing protein [Pseudaestuariivita atlantica]|uniref:vWA domain-containing protein n=1 Tax=Pseudaestuariivita atlantica TaxID=1317121 RepID=UPI00067C23EA|nr:VWA domain-containing protein [Pseudaestuariivita atlantica]